MIPMIRVSVAKKPRKTGNFDVNSLGLCFKIEFRHYGSDNDRITIDYRDKHTLVCKSLSHCVIFDRCNMQKAKVLTPLFPRQKTKLRRVWTYNLELIVDTSK